jgi:hypothetical protein
MESGSPRMEVWDTVYAELQELPVDPEIAPPGVLPAQAKDQSSDGGIERGTTGPAGSATTPSPQELSVPSGDGVRADQRDPPPVPGEQRSGCRQERLVGGSEQRAGPFSAQNPQLVAQHGPPSRCRSSTPKRTSRRSTQSRAGN